MLAAVEERDPWLQKRARETSTQGNVQGECFPKAIGWKTRRDEFCEFLQWRRLKVWSFKGQWVWWGQSPEGTALLLERRQANNPGGQTAWK